MCYHYTTIPILFFCPGMTGEITDPYVINVCIEGLKNGYHVCVYQMRILNENFGVDESGKMNFSEDIDKCLDIIREKYPKAKIYGISGSFGANNLLYYLGDKNKKLPNNKKKNRCCRFVLESFQYGNVFQNR